LGANKILTFLRLKVASIAKAFFPEEETAGEKIEFNASDYDDPIKALLDQYVRPAVENDGGAIDFLGFEDGKVTVQLKGSCAGCPSSTATLKGGIENLLKNHLPEVKEVVAING
jgi:Fe-S cluster biogenesis protein NfuA